MEKVEELLIEMADSLALLCSGMKKVSDYFEWEKQRAEEEIRSQEMMKAYEEEMSLRAQNDWIGKDG